MPARPPLVLLHPYPVDASFWDPLRDRLRTGAEVLVHEAPGFGSAPRRPGWSIADLADEVAARIGAEAPGGRAVVCGLSMGGYAALALAARAPERLAGLVLCDTRAEADDAATRAAREDAAASIRAEGTAAYLAGALPRLLSPAAGAAVRGRLAEIAGRQSPGALVDALAALAGRPDRRGDLPGVGCPALVIVGEDDAPTPPAAARVIAAGIPGARLEVLPDAGHMTALERPAETAALIDDFMAHPPAA
jgi:pimeloyl-ACP methyl ester carboxylesterase